MRLGILADIHEDCRHLALALERLRQEAVEQIVVLGDVADAGRELEATVALLVQAKAVGVWSNHELGLCHEVSDLCQAQYGGPVLDFMQTLQPRLELHGCLFMHGLPFLDPTDPAGYYLEGWPDEPANLARSFQASAHRVKFLGHFHRWLLATAQGCLTWVGQTPVHLDAQDRWLVVVAAVCDGWSAMFDTEDRQLTPLRLGFS
jgi:hypothetical protein